MEMNVHSEPHSLPALCLSLHGLVSYQQFHEQTLKKEWPEVLVVDILPVHGAQRSVLGSDRSPTLPASWSAMELLRSVGLNSFPFQSSSDASIVSENALPSRVPRPREDRATNWLLLPSSCGVTLWWSTISSVRLVAALLFQGLKESFDRRNLNISFDICFPLTCGAFESFEYVFGPFGPIRKF
jgi:hypothetical protein